MLVALDEVDYSFPDVEESVNYIWAAIIEGIPSVILLSLGAWYFRDIFEFTAHAQSMLYAVAYGVGGVGFMWYAIGGPRPSFLADCDIDYARSINGTLIGGAGREYVYLSSCNFDKNTPGRGWPSGHASSAMSIFVANMLWINAKWKPFSTERLRQRTASVFACQFLLIAGLWLSLQRQWDGSHLERQVWAGNALSHV